MDDETPEPYLFRAFAVLCITLAMAPGIIEAARHGDRWTGFMIMGAGALGWLALAPARR